MTTTKDILKKWGDETVDIIQSNMRKAGQNATGETSRNITSKATDDSVTVTGPKHVFTLETGRGPYQGGPEGNLKGKIAQWMQAKGVEPRIGQTIEQASRSIAWFINKEGSKLFREGGRTDIITPAISDKRIDKLTEDIAEVETEKVVNVIEDGISR